MSALRITAVGAVTSIGSSAVQTDASLRTGLCRFHAAPWRPDEGTITLARVRDELLVEPLARVHAELERRRASLDPWAMRAAVLAGLALADALTAAVPRRRESSKPSEPAMPASAPVVLLLGVADPRDGVELGDAAQWWPALAAVGEVEIDVARSRLVPYGRAAIVEVLRQARELLAREPELRVVCGAVDSYAVEARVRHEHAARRTTGGPYAGDGRPLGEAAGMLVVEPSARRRGGLVIDAIGRIDDPGHRFGTAPARGEGLSHAIEALRREAEPAAPFATVWAGLVGESFDVKQWGTACLRHRDLLPDDTRIEHPADRIGDAGAGLGALLFVDAHQRLVAGRSDGPALIWVISDRGPIGAAAVHVDLTSGATP